MTTLVCACVQYGREVVGTTGAPPPMTHKIHCFGVLRKKGGMGGSPETQRRAANAADQKQFATREHETSILPTVVINLCHKS
jgi:hypothetical protein